jgi:hypothetical protein
MCRFVTRSTLPAERALQSWGLAVLGWVVTSVLVVGGVLIAGDLRSGGSTASGDGEPIGREPLRATLGTIHLLLCLLLPLLVRRHLDAIRRTRGLKGQYRNAAIGVALLSALFYLFFWLPGLVAAVVLVGVAVWVATIRVVPAEAMTAEVETQTFPRALPDEREPSAWARWQAGHPALFVLLLLLVPFLLVAVVIAIGLLLV